MEKKDLKPEGMIKRLKSKIEETEAFKLLVTVYGWVIYTVIGILVFISPEAVKEKNIEIAKIPEELTEHVKKHKKTVTKKFRAGKKEVKSAAKKLKGRMTVKDAVEITEKFIKFTYDYVHGIALAVVGKTLTDFVFGNLESAHKKIHERIFGKKKTKEEEEKKEEKQEEKKEEKKEETVVEK